MGIRKNCVAVNKRSPSVMACGPLCAASSASSRKCTHRPRCTDLWAVSEGREEKQEKAPALLLRRRGHNRPQCGRFQGRRLTLFCGLTSSIDADSLKSKEKRHCSKIPNNAITK